MASAIFLWCKHTSTAASKFAISNDWVTSPSKSVNKNSVELIVHTLILYKSLLFIVKACTDSYPSRSISAEVNLIVNPPSHSVQRFVQKRRLHYSSVTAHWHHPISNTLILFSLPSPFDMYIIIIVLPPANEVCEGYVSQVFVCPQGGYLSKGSFFPGGLCPGGVCVTESPLLW